MTDLEDKINPGKIAFDENNQERKSRSCFGQTCSRSLKVFLSQLLVILLIVFGCFWTIHFSKTCDESTVWVGVLCNACLLFLRLLPINIFQRDMSFSIEFSLRILIVQN